MIIFEFWLCSCRPHSQPPPPNPDFFFVLIQGQTIADLVVGGGESRSPRFGVGRLFRFVPICSDLFQFVPISSRFLPISAPCFRECPDLFDLFGFAQFSSDLFRFVFRTNQNKSELIRGIPFCRPIFADPRKMILRNCLTDCR